MLEFISSAGRGDVSVGRGAASSPAADRAMAEHEAAMVETKGKCSAS